MTQASRPAADHVNNYPTSDAGPYSANQWAELFKALFTPDDADQGPLTRYLNELEVTLNAVGPPPVFRVATGGAMVNGHFFNNSAVVDFTVSSPAANPRIDRVVILVNNTNALVTVSDLGFALDFPDDLTDYDDKASVEPYSARLVILQGTEAAAPVAPGLDQNTNHYMIPLYQYEINVAGGKSSAIDQREFCLFASTTRTRRKLVPCVGGWNITDGTEIAIAVTGITNDMAFLLPDAKDSVASSVWVVPDDYDPAGGATLNVKAVVLPKASGNIANGLYIGWSTCHEDRDTNNEQTSLAEAVTVSFTECVAEIDAADFAAPDAGNAPEAGEIMRFVYLRSGTDVLDTIGDDVFMFGFLVTYQSKS